MARMSRWYRARSRSVSAWAWAISASALLSFSVSVAVNSAAWRRGWNTPSTSCARSASIRFSGTFWPLET